MEKTLTQEERIAIIRDAHLQTQTLTQKQTQERIGNINLNSLKHYVEELKTEEVVVEHGLLDSQREDLEDEAQFFLTDSAEEIDEEDEDFGISPEMREVQKQN